MTIQLHLPSEIEEELSQLSQDSNQSIQTYIIDAVRHQLRHLRTKKPEYESALLQKTNLGFSDDFWSRHETLVQKKSAEIITEKELKELIEMTRQIESANAQRLEAAYELALLRNRNPKELMREMGILQDDYAN